MNKTVRILVLIVGMIEILFLSSCFKDVDTFDNLEQYNKEQTAISEYFKANSITDFKQDTAYNLYYRITDTGDGLVYPKNTDYVYINYEGSLLNNGSVFDANDSIYFKLDGLIPGWQILMPKVSEGGTIEMYIPSAYGYGNNDQPKIPANSTLLFEVKLHKVGTRFDYEQYIFDSYLDTEELTHQVDTVEGLKYTIVEEGEGVYASDTSLVNVDYTGKFLNGTSFADQSGTIINLETFSVSGWRVLMPYVRVGSTVNFYIPSKFAYGENGSINVGPNTPLIYQVTLNSIIE